MPLPLLALAASILPEIVRVLAGDRAGAAAASVTEAVRVATGTDDPELAKQKLDADPAAVTALRVQLAQIAIDGERLRFEAEEKRRQAEIDELNKRLADVQSARSTMTSLADKGSAMAWGAPIISLVVTIGFFWTFYIVRQTDLSVNQSARDLMNIIVGSLVAAFTAVVNFWIGSSQGSRDKDATVRTLQAAQSAQAQSAIQGQTEQAQAAIQGLRQLVTTPVAAMHAAGPQKPGNFDRCVAMVLEKEGGFSNHPRDRGGPTNFGITLKAFADFNEMDAASVTEDMMRNLKVEEAREIYRAKYWTAANCDALPPGVDLMTFDFGVNAGVRTSIKMLQELAGVTADGSIGPITLAAVRAGNPRDLINKFAERRLAHYQSLAEFDVFGRGWTARTVSVRDEALRMLEAVAVPTPP
ncbi:glycoside hydrolase family 108 protein [Humitalea sp. 24SJ18S-53]|uniref:glycoside hydrolase family 108 protein n=1 Tax=Humitalea sp. 24SJ18S-53 TaxID=3422307 RepID=UPI003D6640F4